MDEREAARAATLLAARALSNLGDEDVARFLGLPIWEGEARNADVVAVEKALTALAIELHDRCLAPRPSGAPRGPHWGRGVNTASP